MAKNYVKNELGHTEYPKWIDHPNDKTPAGFPKRVLVNNPDEEVEVSGVNSLNKNKSNQEWPKS